MRCIFFVCSPRAGSRGEIDAAVVGLYGGNEGRQQVVFMVCRFVIIVAFFFFFAAGENKMLPTTSILYISLYFI